MSFFKRIAAIFVFVVCPFFTFAQEQIKEYAHFNKVSQLQGCLRKFDLTPFLGTQVLWINDTLETPIQADRVNAKLKKSMKLPKQYTVSQASETNHGYAQTFGFYGPDEVAIYFISFRIDMDTQKIAEIKVEKN